MSTSYMNIRIHQINGDDDVIMYPQTLDTNILVDTSNPNVPSSVTSVNELVSDLGGLAFEDNVAVNVDTSTEYGVIRATDDPTANDSDLMATSKAVSAVNSSAVKITSNQEVDGVKAFNDGINIGGTVSSGTVSGGVNVTYDDSGANERIVFS